MTIYFSSSAKHLEQKFPEKDKIGKLEIKIFPNNEKYVRILDYNELDKEKKYLLVGSTKTDNDIVELILLLDAFNDYKIKPALLIPYFGYGKQDKRFEGQEGAAISAKIFAKIFSRMSNKIYTIDPHFHREPGQFNYYGIEMENISAIPILVEDMKNNYGTDFILIGPDKTSNIAVKYAKTLLGRDVDIAIYNKKRGEMKEKEGYIQRGIEKLEGDYDFQGKTVIMLDDFSSTGGTGIKGANKAKAQNAGKIAFYLTHGVFAGDAIEKLNKAPIGRIVTTDTLLNPYAKVSIIPLIQKIYEDL